MRFYQRAKLWEELRLSKIKGEQDKVKGDALKDCSFNPSLYRPSSAVSLNSRMSTIKEKANQRTS